MADIGALVGPLSVITIAESGAATTRCPNTDFERDVYLWKCFNALCQSAAKNISRLKIGPGNAASKRSMPTTTSSTQVTSTSGKTGPPSESESSKIFDKIVSDLNSARLITR